MCHDGGELVPPLAHTFSFRASRPLKFDWMEKWLANRNEGVLIYTMVSLCLGSLWFMVSMGRFKVTTKQNNCMESLYSLPSLNGGINFKTF